MKKKKLKCYDVTLDSDIYAVSLVTEPAIESTFIYLSKDNKQIMLNEVNKEKRIVMGAVLIPDFPIYRNQDDEEFYIQFSKDTIEQLAYKYMESNHIKDFTLQHEEDASNITVVESWIKTSENDKSKDYNIDVPIGTWLMAARINNDEVWEKVKSGEMNGFSIEAFVNLQEIKLNKLINDMALKNTKMEAVEIDDKFWDKIRSIIADALGKGEKEPEVEDTVGEIVDAIEDGAGSKDSETKVVEQEEVKEGDETPDVLVDEEVKDVVEAVEEVTETPAETTDALQAVIDGLNEEIKKKDEEIETLKKENAKLSKKPSAKPVTKMASQKQNPRDVIEKLYAGTYFGK